MAEHVSSPDLTCRARRGLTASLLALAACAAAVAASPPVAAQAGGTTVLLPVSGIRVPVPGTASDWKVSSMRDQGNQQMDVLEAVGASVPKLTLAMRVSIDPLGCSLPLNKSLGAFPPGTQEVHRPSYLPPSFEPKALESPLTGGKGAVVCANIPKGDAVVKVVYKGTRFQQDMAKMKATLEAYAKEAARLGPAAQGKAAPSTPSQPTPPPPPPPPPPPTTPSGKLTLATAGVTIQLPAGWRHQFVDDYQQPGKDVLIRYQGDEIDLVLRPPAGSMNCAQWQKVTREQYAPNARWVQRPSYAPPAYFASVAEDKTNSADTLSSRLCLDTKDNGAQEVFVYYSATARDGARPAYALLEQIAASLLSAPVLPSTLPQGTTTPQGPPPPTMPEPTSTPAPTYMEDAPSYSGFGSRRWKTFRKRTSSPWVELGGVRMAPSDGAVYDNTAGAYLRIKDTSVEGKSAFGFAWTVSGQMGFDSKANIPFDLKAGLGFGVHLGPLTLIPLLEAGADAAAGGEAGAYKVPAAFNVAAEGVVRLHLYGPVGLEGSASRVLRGNWKGKGNDAVSAENRVEGQLKISRFGFGVRFIDYKTARQLAGTFGLAF